MFDRLDHFARKLPEPRFGASWDVYYQQHIKNAERMRAQAFRYALEDLGHGLRSAGRRLRAAVHLDRPVDAQGGAD